MLPLAKRMWVTRNYPLVPKYLIGPAHNLIFTLLQCCQLVCPYNIHRPTNPGNVGDWCWFITKRVLCTSSNQLCQVTSDSSWVISYNPVPQLFEVTWLLSPVTITGLQCDGALVGGSSIWLPHTCYVWFYGCEESQSMDFQILLMSFPCDCLCVSVSCCFLWGFFIKKTRDKK
jgi:hypothetical protein